MCKIYNITHVLLVYLAFIHCFPSKVLSEKLSLWKLPSFTLWEPLCPWHVLWTVASQSRDQKELQNHLRPKETWDNQELILENIKEHFRRRKRTKILQNKDVVGCICEVPFPSPQHDLLKHSLNSKLPDSPQFYLITSPQSNVFSLRASFVPHGMSGKSGDLRGQRSST